MYLLSNFVITDRDTVQEHFKNELLRNTFRFFSFFIKFFSKLQKNGNNVNTKPQVWNVNNFRLFPGLEK